MTYEMFGEERWLTALQHDAKKSRKKAYYFRTTFLIKVVDTHIYSKEDGIKDLTTRTNYAGIRFTVTQKTDDGNDDIFWVQTRTNSLKNAIKDRNFLSHALKQTYGGYLGSHFEGMKDYKRKNVWIPYSDEEIKELLEK